uniref:Mitochondrial import inner membrane translocase subunit n=1 Tax=Sphenodon punctatus TaxID=8508 RepID=A0A8D0GFI4_SPHPU
MAGQISESDQMNQCKEFLGPYNKLTETCFLDCVEDFTCREVKSEEMTCSENCLQNEALATKAGLLGQPC